MQPAASNQSSLDSLYAQQEFRIYQRAIEEMKVQEDKLPSLPTLTLDIRRAVTDPNVTHHKLVGLISRDPSLTAILLKHASSVFYRTTDDKPKNLQEAIRRLGLRTLESLVLTHSIKSLFVMNDQRLKHLYKLAWRRQVLKACMSLYMGRQMRLPSPDDLLVASMLSEVGTMALLVALQQHAVPDEKTYRVLCQHYSKHLGAILLVRWGVDYSFLEILRQTGDWDAGSSEAAVLPIDVINLALFHTVHQLHPDNNDMPPIEELSAYRKLSPRFNTLTDDTRRLTLVEHEMDAIKALANSFGG